MTAVVEFKRGKGSSGFDLSADAAGLPSGADALRMLSEPLAGGDPRAKRVTQGALLKALENGPFEDYPRAVYGWRHVFERVRTEGRSASRTGRRLRTFFGGHSTA